MPDFAKDICLALLGGDLALAGLLLVVAGFALAQVNTFPATTDDVILKRYEVAAKLALVPFLLALVDAAICLMWLLHQGYGFYVVAVGLFFLLLLLTAVYGAILLLHYL
jgi:hypothetical protein